MKDYQPGDIRNFAIVGHASSGKTMLSEAMLACAGVINRMGTISAGTTVSDYHESEQNRQISVSATLMHLEWLNKKFNILDCPGYADFISEGLGALRVGDFALIVVHANHGVGVGTDAVWKYATEDGIPKMIVVNAFDKEETDFDKTLAQVREHFGERVFPLTIPLNAGPGFNQVLDVLRNEVITYATDKSGKFTEAPTTGELAEKVKKLHEQLIEFTAESDDALMEKFFAQGGLSEEEMRAGLHAAIQKQVFTPLFVTAAESNIGVARLMDIISKYGSSPVDRANVKATDGDGKDVEVTLTDPDPVLYVFKTMSEAQFGEMSFFRIYSGSVKFGSELYNTGRRSTEKIGQIYMLNGKTRTSVPSLSAGDIGAVVKLKDTHTGNTLCGGKKPVTLPKVDYPKPNIHASLKSGGKGEEDKIATGLAALHHEDPTFLYSVDSELRQTIVSAQGELHLEVIADALRRRYNVHVELVEPRVRYRETIKGKGDSKYRHKKQTGGAGQFAEVWMRIEPKPRDSGLEFTNSLVGQNVDRTFVPSVEKGVLKAGDQGILAGYRVTDVKIDFYDGKMHPVDSKDIAFQIAGYFAFKEAFMAARPCLLEPIYKVEIRIPEDCMGKVMGDLSSRRGKIQGMDMEGTTQVIKAHVPGKELYRYSSTLRSLTGGRSVHAEEFSHYEEMPREAESKVVEEHKKARLAQQANSVPKPANDISATPAALGFSMPAEWEPHEATWLGWPHNPNDWPDKLDSIRWVYGEMVRKISPGESIRILVNNQDEARRARGYLTRAGADIRRVQFITHATNRGWMRDSGPIFVRRRSTVRSPRSTGRRRKSETAIVHFHFNAWAKYGDWQKDRLVPELAARILGKRLFNAEFEGKDFVIEGGGIDVNGRGTLLTTEECYLDPKVQVRNPGLGRREIDQTLKKYLGVTNVLWLIAGPVGDDTHGHIDDICRFVNPKTLVLIKETNRKDPNYRPLAENWDRIQDLRLEDGSRPEVVPLPMPAPLHFDGYRLPASYANFYISNAAVIVPTFNDPNDRIALGTLGELFKDRPVIGIHAVDLVLGFGTLHCLTQQQPA